MRNLIPIIFKILSYLPNPAVCIQYHVATRLIALRCIDTLFIPFRLWHHMLGCVSLTCPSLTQMSSSAVSGSNNPTSGHRWCCCLAWSSSHSVPPPAQAFPMCTQGRHPHSSQVLTSCTNTSTRITSSPHWASDTSVQCSRSVVSNSVAPWTEAGPTSLSITSSWSLLKLMSIYSVIPSNHLIFCHPLLLLPSIFPSRRVFSNESVLRIRWPKYWSFSFNINPSNEYSGLISFRIDLLDLLAVQGTLKSLLQHHSSKASILQCSAFFIVQLSHPYMTTGKTIALTRRTFVGKLTSLLCNTLSRLVITFLPRSKCLLISWLQSLSAVISEPPPPPQKKICHCFHCFLIYLPWTDGTRCHDLSFLNIEF